MKGARAAAAVMLLGCALQRCAAQLPGMMPPPRACAGALNGPAPRSDLSWPANETQLSEALRQADEGKVSHLAACFKLCWVGKGPFGAGFPAMGA